MTSHDFCLRWRCALLVAAAMSLAGACGDRPSSTTITAVDEGDAPTEADAPREPDGGTGGEEPSGVPQPEGAQAQTDGPVPGQEQPGGAPTGPGESDGPGPGETGGGGPAGPVGETETGGETGGPAAVPGEVGMFWWRPESKWATVIDEVFDVCDDSEALFAITGWRLGPGDEPADLFWFDRAWEEVLGFRAGHGVSCEKPGGLRYVVATENGAGPPGVSPQDAVEQLRIGRENSPHYGEVIGRPGNLLGYYGLYYHVYDHVDEVKVMPETVTVADNTIRGLVQNLSETMWARDVTVAAGGSKWVWPLTVQPGEVAPFEIEGWTGTTDPAAIDLQVTATLSTTVDVSRALQFTFIEDAFKGTWEQYLNRYPAFAVPEPPDGEFNYVDAFVDIQVPTSHPSLTSQVTGQTINNLKAYVAFGPGLDSKRVTDVISASTYYYELEEFTETPISQLPTNDGYYNFHIGFHSKGLPHIWVGQAN